MLNEKLYIYYHPGLADDELNSFGLSYYNFDIDNDTYSLKAVAETQNGKLKHKENRVGLSEFIDFLENLEFAIPSDDPTDDESYFYIKYGEDYLIVKDAEKISEILDKFEFYQAARDLLGYSID